ncbi:hypothetical protein BKA70DRAFT_1307852 [Coprinopsis sp. MPI-PUGE-AT-0042]|nr:hypothetical protein BKA70DRAFT_1307852 [Coprinopsis sp. MPI-PUGE-AT-0042]
MRIDATELYIRDNVGATHLWHSEEENGGRGEEGELPDVERPEIDGGMLRSMLLEALSDEVVVWGKKSVSISKSSSPSPSSQVSGGGKDRPQYDLHFADGTSTDGFDIVVGVVGTWSKVRTVISKIGEVYE